MKNIEEFIDLIISEKGLTHKDPEVLTQIKKDLTDRFDSRINVMIVSNLPEDKMESFNDILGSGNEEEVNKFITTNIPDIEEKLASEMLIFKNLYLN